MPCNHHNCWEDPAIGKWKQMVTSDVGSTKHFQETPDVSEAELAVSEVTNSSLLF